MIETDLISEIKRAADLLEVAGFSGLLLAGLMPDGVTFCLTRRTTDDVRDHVLEALQEEVKRECEFLPVKRRLSQACKVARKGRVIEGAVASTTCPPTSPQLKP